MYSLEKSVHCYSSALILPDLMKCTWTVINLPVRLSHNGFSESAFRGDSVSLVVDLRPRIIFARQERQDLASFCTRWRFR